MPQIVWDAFKAYVQGILIAVKSTRQRTQDHIGNELMQRTKHLEAINKQVPTLDRMDELSQITHYQQIKMTEAIEVSQSIMYVKQSAFEYKDKARKQLARVLSEHQCCQEDTDQGRR